MKNIYQDDPEKMLELAGAVCRMPDDLPDDKAGRIVSEMKNFAEDQLLEFLRRDTPDDIASMLIHFNYELERFGEIMAFPEFAARNVVGIGGRFSSGKSSFLNAIAGERLLPTGTTPTTSIPAFIGHGEETVAGVNIFNALVDLDRDAIHVLKHWQGAGGGFAFAHILKRIFISTPAIRYENLVFLDTPGYSSGAGKRDEETARAQLNSSSHIIWLIDADNGTITDNDINFIQGLETSKPLLIVVTKADRKKQDIDSIIIQIREEKRLAAMNVVDVLPFSARKKKLFPVERIEGYLEQWNMERPGMLFHENFRKFFVGISEYFISGIEEARMKLNRVNRAMAASDNDETVENFDVMRELARLELERLRKKQQELDGLESWFMERLNKACLIGGLPDPPPPISMEQESRTNFIDIIRRCHENAGFANRDYSTLFLELVRLNEQWRSPGIQGNADDGAPLPGESLVAAVRAYEGECAFEGHLMENADSDDRELYVIMLAGLAGHLGYKKGCAEFFHLVVTGLDLKNPERYLRQAAGMSVETVSDAISSIREDNERVMMFMTDALVMACLDGEFSNDTALLLGMISDLVGQAEDEFSIFLEDEWKRLVISNVKAMLEKGLDTWGEWSSYPPVAALKNSAMETKLIFSMANKRNKQLEDEFEAVSEKFRRTFG